MGVAENQIPFLAVEPECYKVFLDPKLYQDDGTIIKHDVTYEGRVEVIFRPKTDTSVISLHVGLLNIVGDPSLKRRLSMDTPTEQVLQEDSKYELNTEVDTTQETMTVTVGETLKAGHYYSLFVNFTGNIGLNAGGGFFKVVIDNKKDVQNQWYVATKMAPRKARNLLPCVDNPKHKAVFEMSVVRSKDTNVVFNTKVRKTEPYKENLLVDHFEKTGMIRPDSLGLFMSNFQSNQVPTTDHSVELTVWSPESSDSIELINDVVPQTLDFMASYLATKFPTNKLDIVVVPSMDIIASESPGLIVVENTVMATKEKSSLIEYETSALTIVEHVIRQWLMPLRGLDRGSHEDKWLNDAIVKFLRIINIDHIKPEWKYGNRFAMTTIQTVMFYDSWTYAESLAHYEKHTEIYNHINSAKGTAILRMLNYTFTEDVFKQTLREYVHTEIYKYKDTISFWTLLDDNVRNKSVKLPESSSVLQVVNTWTHNKNYPLVKLQIDGDDLVVKQFRFDYNELVSTSDWVIPITLTSGAAYSTTVWLENNSEIRIPGYISASNGTWILANQHQTGYYRVAYEDALLDRLLYEITVGKSFDEYTVAQLITDLIEEALADVVGFGNAMDFLDRTITNAESHFGYWNAIFKAFEKLESVFHNSKHYDKFLVYMDGVISNAYVAFKNNKVDVPDQILCKMETLRFAGRIELTQIVQLAKSQFKSWKESTDEINPIAVNDREIIYCTVIQYATKDELKFLLEKYTKTKWPPARKSMAKSFACSRNLSFLKKVLLGETMKPEDLVDIWQSILNDPVAGPYAFTVLRNNWETLTEKYIDSNVDLLSMMLHAAIRGLHNLSGLENLQVFSEKYFGKTIENRNQTLMEVLRFEEEILRQKITWVEKYDGAMDVWVTSKLTKIKGRKYNYGNNVVSDSSEKLAPSEQPATDGVTSTTVANQTSTTKTVTEPDASAPNQVATSAETPVVTPTEINTSTSATAATPNEPNASAPTTSTSDASAATSKTTPDASAATTTDPNTSAKALVVNTTEPDTSANVTTVKTIEPGTSADVATVKTTEPGTSADVGAVKTTKPDTPANVATVMTTKSDTSTNVVTVNTTDSDTSVKTSAVDTIESNASAAPPAESPSAAPNASINVSPAATTTKPEDSANSNVNNINLQRLNRKRNKKRDREEVGDT